MFFPPKQSTILTAVAMIAATVIASKTYAQRRSIEFERRAAAIRDARARGRQTVQATYLQDDAAAGSSAKSRIDEVFDGPTRPERHVPVAGASARRPSPGRNYSRPQARLAQAGSGTRGGSGSRIAAPSVGAPLVQQSVVDGGPIIQGGPIIEGGPIVDSNVYYEDQYGGEVIYDDTIHGDVIDGGYVSEIGADGGYFDEGCCGRGGCPDGPCWLGNIGRAFRTAEFFGGATAFQSPLFTAPGQPVTATGAPADPNILASDSSFGAFGGFNLGVPLCRLSCGFLSGQFGIRSVTTNFQGNEFSPEDRRQIFVTAGIYRRVDHGLQLGVVADILHEEWFTESDVVQVRTDIAWVYPAGHTLGFRSANGTQDESTDGVFNGIAFTDFLTSSDDQYRFYYRHVAARGGYAEWFAGWAEADQGILGIDVDLPITEFVAFNSGFTFFINDEIVPAASNFQGGNQNEAWNLYVGLTLRAQGRSAYRNYDRPLFNVADNGSFLIRRQSPQLSTP